MFPFNLPARIQRRITVVGECWLWDKTDAHGYGQVQWGGRRSPAGNRMPTPVHIVVYELLVGEVPDGHILDHKCRHRDCCRPGEDHVHPVSNQENSIVNSNGITAQYAARTQCAYGHDLTVENAWYIRPDGKGRMCYQCCLERVRGRRERKPVERLISLP